MLSRHFNELLYDYRALIFLGICLGAQWLGWRLFFMSIPAAFITSTGAG